MSIQFQIISNQESVQRMCTMAASIWRKHYTAIIGSEQVEYMLKKFQSPAAVMAQLKDGYTYYNILLNEIPVGYFSVQARGDLLFLSKCYVKETQRGKGLGKAALEKVMLLASNAQLSKIQLTVNKYNTDSLNFYLSHGFQKEADAVFDIGNGFFMDDFVLSMNIKY